MIEVQQDILCALLQTLLKKKLICRDIHDKARNRILAMAEFPAFFRDEEDGLWT